MHSIPRDAAERPPHDERGAHRPSPLRRSPILICAVAALAVGAASCDGGDDPDSTLGPVQTVQRYFERFADRDMDGAARLMATGLVTGCGGHDATVEALHDARAAQDGAVRIAGGRFEDGPTPRVVATPRAPAGSGKRTSGSRSAW